MVGLFFLFFPRYRKKPPGVAGVRPLVPSRAAPLPRGGGRHAWRAGWSGGGLFVVFYCFFVWFLLLSIAMVPGSSAQRPRAGAPLPLSPSRWGRVRCPRRGAAAAPRLRLRPLNRMVAVADVRLSGGQCWKERQTPHGPSLKSTLRRPQVGHGRRQHEAPTSP